MKKETTLKTTSFLFIFIFRGVRYDVVVCDFISVLDDGPNCLEAFFGVHVFTTEKEGKRELKWFFSEKRGRMRF